MASRWRDNVSELGMHGDIYPGQGWVVAVSRFLDNPLGGLCTMYDGTEYRGALVAKAGPDQPWRPTSIGFPVPGIRWMVGRPIEPDN